MSGVICGGGSRWARRVFRCPLCKARRRILSRIEMGGWGSRLICGGCGGENGDLEGFRRLGKRDSAKNRETVRREWPGARTKQEERDALWAMIEPRT